MTTKDISLNISERLAALSILNAFRGNTSLLATIIEDIKQFNIEDAEWTAAMRTISEPDKEGNVRWNWNDEEGGEKEVSLQEATVEYLRTSIKDKDDKGEFGLQDKAFITLKAKLV